MDSDDSARGGLPTCSRTSSPNMQGLCNTRWLRLEMQPSSNVRDIANVNDFVAKVPATKWPWQTGNPTQVEV